MAFIRTIPPDEATGLLKRLYDQAQRRAGHVWHVVRLMSLRPPMLHGAMELYTAVMLGRSRLTRSQREMIAVVVSRENDCYY